MAEAADYLLSVLPLATALAALMRPGPGGRSGLKIALNRRVQASTIDRARLSLIVYVIESYLRLDEQELRAFREQLRVEGAEVDRWSWSCGPTITMPCSGPSRCPCRNS